MAKHSDNVGETRALVLRLYKKFPHLFKKTSNPHNPRTFSLSVSTTRGKVEEAFRMLKLSDNITDLVGFKKLFSVYLDVEEETATKPNLTPGMPSRNYHSVNGERLFPFKNEFFEHLNDDKESVKFDFGDDYGNRREFAELEKELVFGYAWRLRVSRREFKDSRCRVKDIYKLSSLEEMLKEFANNYLF